MGESKRVIESERAWGDAAVDGLLAGGAAGVAMGGYLWLASLAQGRPGTGVFSLFDPRGSSAPLTGALVHLAVAGVYGVVFGLGRRLTGDWPAVGRWPGWLAGQKAPPERRQLPRTTALASVASVQLPWDYCCTARKRRPRAFQRNVAITSALWGVAYGLILLALAWTVILPGVNSAVLSIPAIHLAIAHVIYGLVTGILVSRR